MCPILKAFVVRLCMPFWTREKGNSADIVQLLLDAGAYVNLQGGDYGSPLTVSFIIRPRIPPLLVFRRTWQLVSSSAMCFKSPSIPSWSPKYET
jgi:hypothetical protein